MNKNTRDGSLISRGRIALRRAWRAALFILVLFSAAASASSAKAADVATVTSIESSPNPSAPEQNVTFTATVRDGLGHPVTAGAVRFEDKNGPFGTVALNSNGQAAFSLSTLSIGSHNVTANFQGAAGFLPSNNNLIQTVNCNFSLSSLSQTMRSCGGAGSVSVTAFRECSWTVVNGSGFVTITSGASGTGNGTVTFSVQPNPSASPRTATLIVAGVLFTLNQEGGLCVFSISPTSQAFAVNGGAGSVSVTGPAGSNYTAVSNAGFITITSGASGTGNGTVSYSVAANPDPAARTGTITIAGLTFTVTQAGTATGNCTFTLAQSSRAFNSRGGADSVFVTTQAGCIWAATSDANWVTVITTVGGNEALNFQVAANTDPARRVATISVSGQTLSVMQGASFTDVPQSHPFFDEIGKISALGITQGRDVGLFSPDEPVTRAETAVFIVRALGIFNPPLPASQRFADVPPSHFAYAFIHEFARRQITNGCSFEKFCPGTNTTRAEMAAFVDRAVGITNPPPPSSPSFPDVTPEHAFYPFIEDMFRRGITKGCGRGLFCPDAPVTRAAMAAFIVRLFGL